MAATPPSSSKSSSDKQSGAPAAPLSFEDNLQQFWQKNHVIVIALCVLVLAVILGKGGYEWYTARQEGDIETTYQNATTPEQLRAFIKDHPNHPLAGIAELKLADDAFTANKGADALAGYERAAAILKNGPLAARAQLGRAQAKLQLGKTAEGTADLKQLVGDANQFKAVRTEAAYQLASMAVDAGNATEAQNYIAQLNQIDPTSMWARRAMSLLANLPPSAAPAAPATPAAGAASAPQAQSTPTVQVNVPVKK
jgi:predicted negative regulator of RcsB-dependent stress response